MDILLTMLILLSLAAMMAGDNTPDDSELMK